MKGETVTCLTGIERISVDYSRKVAKCRGISPSLRADRPCGVFQEPTGMAPLSRSTRMTCRPRG
jgi:hypothetical protein